MSPSMPAVRSVALTLLASAMGCATGHGAGALDEPVATAAPLVDARPLAGAGRRCEGATCRCRPVDAYGKTEGFAGGDPEQVLAMEGMPAEGMKRFELRTGRGTDKVEITVEGRGSFAKQGVAGDVDPACGYVDLPPGKHRVRVHISPGAGQDAISPKVMIYELGQRTGSWYATFGLSCAASESCSLDELKDLMKGLHRARGLFDPCGSVKVRTPRWSADKAADGRVAALDLELGLEVYRFQPRTPRGGTCSPPPRD